MNGVEAGTISGEEVERVTLVKLERIVRLGS